MRGRGVVAVVAIVAAVWLAPARAAAFDPDGSFAKDTVIFSLQVGGGTQNNVEEHGRLSDISFVNFTPRLSWLPFGPVGSGWLHGAFEPGLEGWFQYYLEPREATAEGLKAVGRYHFLSLGRVVPYAELGAGVGASSLKLLEIRATLNFVLEAGVGLSYFLADDVAFTAGYRFQHISNGNVERPNRGFNSDTGTLGVSYFFH
jgi:opacity protein-like surface antigen